MPLEKTDNLRWAAIQLLQNYARCGVSLVARGTNRLAVQWSEESPTSDVMADDRKPTQQFSSAISTPTEHPPTATKAAPGPLPPMPMVPLKSAAKDSAKSGGLNIGGAKWLGPVLPEAERLDVFGTLRDQVASCRKCEELACTRKQTVFGVGTVTPRVVFFGEAPGADEDRKGEPFVGAAGQLLDKIIVASKMKREEVYILNSLKCRPPGNRTPVDVEIENCRPFFEAQLEVLQPEFIVCLGAVAVRAVLRTTESVGRLRGKFHRYRGAQVLVTYHPAYLLRNESAKKYVWDDMKLLMIALGLQPPDT